MDSPIVSIIVLTYNHEQFIARCLDSILQQATDYPFEIIVGEDESSDRTREICEMYAKKYGQIKLLLHRRADMIRIHGLPSGRNNFLKCYAACTGKYIAFCEGDDYWVSPLKLQKQVELLEQHPEATGSYHDTILVDFENNPFGNYKENLPSEMGLEQIIGRTGPFHTSSFFARRSAVVLPDFMKTIMSSDIALFAIVASSGKLLKADDVMSAYRKHPGGVTSTGALQGQYHRMRIDLWQELKSYFNGKATKEFDEMIAFHQLRIDLEARHKPSERFIDRMISRIKRVFRF